VSLVFEDAETRLVRASGQLWLVAGRRLRPVECHFSSPLEPANPAFPQNYGCIALFPKSALKPGAAYEARVIYEERPGETRVFAWRFETE
jgi:hypothetical protein